MPYEALIYEKQDHVALITLNRPDKLNALNFGLRQELIGACREAQEDDEVRAVIITGAGTSSAGSAARRSLSTASRSRRSPR